MSRAVLCLFLVLTLSSAAHAQDEAPEELPSENELEKEMDVDVDMDMDMETCPEPALASDKDGFDCMQEFELPAGPYVVYWTVDGTLLKMGMQGVTEGWVGIAFAESAGSMVPSDFVIGYVDGDDVSVKPYYSTARAISEDNLEDDITLEDVKGEEEDGVTTIYFTRDTAEEGNVPIDLTAETAINFAVGAEDDLVYHMTNRASGTIKFSA